MTRRHRRDTTRIGIAVAITLALAVGTIAGGTTPGSADGNEAPGSPAAFRTLSAGGDHTCAILAGGGLKCWGSGNRGQLGLGSSANVGSPSTSFVDLGTGRTATSVSAGGSHTCAVLDNATVKCWGWAYYGQPGLGDGMNETTAFNRGNQPGEMGDNLPAVDLGTGRTATVVVSSEDGACALLDNATVKCWGKNIVGQVGFGGGQAIGDEPGEMGDNLPAVALGTGRTATAIAAGAEHYCALLDDGTVKCWGSNNNGQLGQGDTANRGGNAMVEMGDNLPPIALGTGRTATAISAGGNVSCALLDNGRVKCWGRNFGGVLGQGDTVTRGDGPNEMGDNLLQIQLGAGRTATGVAVGYTHVCALLDDGSVKCWGDAGFGRLGLGDEVDRGDGPGGDEMGDNLPRVQLGTGLDATAIVAGDWHTCARLSNGGVKCWGHNDFGKLGLGDEGDNNRGDAAGEMGDNLPALVLQPPPPPLSTGVTGTVSESGSGAPIGGAWVALLSTVDFSLVSTDVAGPSGDFIARAAPGSYLLYVIDPTGRHPAGFFGDPTIVTVTAGPFTEVDPSLEALRGSIAGTITETGTGTPLGAWAIALSGTTGAPVSGVAADETGQFTIGDLQPGDHLTAYLDPTGSHATQFFAGTGDPAEATPVPVTAGAAATADVSLPTQTVTGTGAALTGRVTESGTATPLPGTWVLALRTSDFALARAAVTTTTGAYTLHVTPGDYRLAFLDPAGRHTMEWHLDQAYSDLALAAPVQAPANTNAALDAGGGSMIGTVTESNLGYPLAGAWVVAIGPTGIQGGAVTGADGSYEIHDLPPGSYRATIVDPNGAYGQVYWHDATSYEDATVFAVNAADTTTIDVALTPS